MTMSDGLSTVPDLVLLSDLEMDPEYVLAFTPPFLYGKVRDRITKPGIWDLLTVAECEAAIPAREGWSHDGYADTFPLLLGAWVKTLLGFPVVLEADETAIRLPGVFSRWHRVPFYWVRRNT